MKKHRVRLLAFIVLALALSCICLLAWCCRPFYLRPSLAFEDEVPLEAREVISTWHDETDLLSPLRFSFEEMAGCLSDPWSDHRPVCTAYPPSLYLPPPLGGDLVDQRDPRGGETEKDTPRNPWLSTVTSEPAIEPDHPFVSADLRDPAHVIILHVANPSGSRLFEFQRPLGGGDWHFTGHGRNSIRTGCSNPACPNPLHGNPAWVIHRDPSFHPAPRPTPRDRVDP